MQGQHNLQHLRRFVKPQALPEPLELTLKDKPSNLYFLVCRTNIISLQGLEDILSGYISTNAPKLETCIHHISIPLQPPNSEDQARAWSRQFWPTVYKRSNLLGPQPAFVERAQEEISKQASHSMSLAWAVALEGKAAGLGETVGAVVISEGGPVVVAVDGRYAPNAVSTGNDSTSKKGDNSLAHSVLRAIGLIAQKRQSQSQEPRTSRANPSFKDYTMTPLEDHFFQASVLPENGYLCVDLDIYLTHEPCIMCSMALLHSRFRRVIFEKSMPKTGGLHSTDDGYGLWWRDELNWKMLCWRWQDDNKQNDASDVTLSENIHA